MRTLYSDALPPLWGDEQLWAYNALDCCITREVFDDLSEQLAKHGDSFFAYDMPRAMQGPALTMMRRGCKIDLWARDRELVELNRQYDRACSLFTRITEEAFGRALNPRSIPDLRVLFHECLGVPEVMIYDKTKRERRPSLNREALEKVRQTPVAAPFVALLTDLRGVKKLKEALEAGVDSDGRMRCGYNVTGTMTGRWSSNESALGSGTNLQNVSDRARRMFVPDSGLKLCQIDLAQAESKAVAAISGDEAYRAATLSGDLHTYVARLCWPHLPWGTGDDKAVAKRVYLKFGPVEFSYRDMAKRAGHGTNYGGSAAVIAKTLRIPLRAAEEFQRAYFAAFPGIARWHRRVQAQLAINRTITTPLGRRCQFLGRATDSETLKSAIAYGPQSTIGDILNLGLYKVWQRFDQSGQLQLLLQVHDSIVFQYDPAVEATLIPQVQETLRTPISVDGYILDVASDAMVGWNWGKASGDNPFGLAEWHGEDTRKFVA